MAFVLITPPPMGGMGDRITIRHLDQKINLASGNIYHRPCLRIAIGNNIANKFKFALGKKVNAFYDNETNRIRLALGEGGYCLSRNSKYSMKLIILFPIKINSNNDAYYEEDSGSLIIHLDNKVVCG